MTAVLGVHGIGQKPKSGRHLADRWSAALGTGLAGFDPPIDRVPELVVPQLWPLLSVTDRLGPGDPDDPATLSDDELTFVESGLEDVLDNLDQDEIDRLALEGQTLAVPALPRALHRRLAAIDGRWPGGAKLVLRMLREVHTYLEYASSRENITERVVRAVNAPTTVIAHSLGSVIAYDVLRRGKLPSVTTLITCGSPLAWPTVRRGLQSADPDGAPSPSALPGATELGLTWTNVHDPRDAVTAALTLGDLYPGAEDRRVSNPLHDAHGAGSYLAQPDLVRALFAT